MLTSNEFVSDRIIVKLKSGVADAGIETARQAIGAGVFNAIQNLDLQVWSLPPGLGVEQALSRLERNPIFNALFDYAQPDYILSIAQVPNDPGMSVLWGLKNTNDADIDAPEAWDMTTGSSDVVVGVIDTGVDYTHPDLDANIWVNPGEVPGDGIDNDGNGYVDDVHGYDFANNDGAPLDGNGHGTHVAGTIAAEANNGLGSVGINWSAKIMALKFLTDQGSGSTSDAVEAIQYATMMKRQYGVNINVTNNSWGGGGYNQALYDAIAAAGQAGQLFIAAAGNNGSNNNILPAYPSSYSLNTIISVAATTDTDGLADFSNYGSTTVDLGAPGDGIYSTVPGNGYDIYSGTSMATPHVTGVASLIWSLHPTWSATQVKQAILDNVDPLPALSGVTVTGGRLNALHALNPPPSNQAPIVNAGTDQTITTASLALDATVSDDGLPNGTVTYTWSKVSGPGTVTFSPAGVEDPTATFTSSGNYVLRLTASDGQLSQSDTVAVAVSLPASSGKTYYISPVNGTSIGSLRVEDEDIAAYNPQTNTWSRYFDGSDVGLSASDIDAFTQLSDGSLLFSLNTSASLPGVGSITNRDIIRFTPTSLGETTTGSFSLFQRGSNVGLNTSYEDIDGIHVLSNGRLVVSVATSLSVPGVSSGLDEDLIVFTPSTAGNYNSGTWAMYFDGSDVGLATTSSEDVRGSWVDPSTGKVYLSTQGTFAVPGVSGDGNDVFVFTPTALGNTTSGSFAPFWNAATNGFNDSIDALSLG